MIAASTFLLVAGVYLSGYVLYWWLLVVTQLISSGRSSSPGPVSTRFAIVIPAHDEELFLSQLLESVRNQDYPEEFYEAIVVADNCTDRTAAIGRDLGATVLERFDNSKQGKGYAIKWTFDIIDLDKYDAVLIVDADCTLSSNALRSLDATLQVETVIQCYNGVGNPDESWFTRLLDVSRTINNQIYNPAKQKLGLSSELTGTGMCFAISVLKKHQWDAFSVGEDWEYYAKLIQGGETVGFDVNARVYHVESSSLRQATTQRMRWSSGRFAVAARYGFPLLSSGVRHRDLTKFDAGLSLIFPNPSLGMNITLLCLCIAFLAMPAQGTLVTWWFVLLAAAQIAIFVLGIFYTENRLSKLLAIVLAPIFLAWKMGIDALSILGVGRRKWIRTERKP